MTAWLTPVEEINRRMLRARDAMDRSYAEPLDVAALATLVHSSKAHFIRTFRTTFGETPHRYLQRRRIERAMFLMRTTELDVTRICMAVGYSSLGTFSRTFREVVGQSPTAYRREVQTLDAPGCFVMRWTRPTEVSGAVPEKRPAAVRP